MASPQSPKTRGRISATSQNLSPPFQLDLGLGDRVNRILSGAVDLERLTRDPIKKTGADAEHLFVDIKGRAMQRDVVVIRPTRAESAIAPGNLVQLVREVFGSHALELLLDNAVGPNHLLGRVSGYQRFAVRVNHRG